MNTLHFKNLVFLTLLILGYLTNVEAYESLKKPVVDSLNLVGKWLIIRHFHPGTDAKGEKAEANSYLLLKKDGTYQMNYYGSNRTGAWKLQKIKRMVEENEREVEKEQTILLLTIPEAKEGEQQDLQFVITLKGKNQLFAESTYDPTSFWAKRGK